MIKRPTMRFTMGATTMMVGKAMAKVIGQELSQRSIKSSTRPMLMVVTTSDMIPDIKNDINRAKTTGAKRGWIIVMVPVVIGISKITHLLSVMRYNNGINA